MRRFRIETKTEKMIVFLVALLMVAGGALIWYVDQAAGATYTWDAGGADNNWSTCANWTSDTCPGSGDIAHFDSSTTTNSVVDASFAGSVAGVDIDAGYTGTITQERNLTIDGSGFAQDDGTWRQGTTTFDINSGGSYSLSAGIFETGVGTSTVERNVTISGGTYTASSTSAMTFDGGYQDDSTLSCSGEFGGVIDLANPDARQSFTLASGCSATTSGNISTVNNVTVNGTLHFAGDVNINGDNHFTNNGTTTMSGTSFTVEGNFTQNGIFDLSGISLTFDGGHRADSILTCTGALGTPIDLAKTDTRQYFRLASGCHATTTGSVSTQNNMIIDGIFHIAGDFTINGYADYTNNGTTTIDGTSLSLWGDFSQNGSFDLSGVTITFAGDYQDYSTLTCSGELGGLVDVAKSHGVSSFTLVNGCSVTGTTTTSSSGITLNGTWATGGTTLTGSSLSVGSNGTLRLHGDETLTSPSLSSGATVDYYGSGTYSSLIAGTDYEHLSFSGGGTYNITDSVTVAGDFTSTNDSTFNQTSDTLTLDGSGQQTVTGTSTFNNFTKTVTATSALFFGANQEQTVSGALTLQGDSDSTLYMKSTATGTQAKLDIQGLHTLEYLTVSDMNNTNGSTVYCDPGCVDDDNNTNITFSANPDGDKIYWDGGGGDNNWSTCDNWTYNTCPDENYTAAFDDRDVTNSTLDASFAGEVSGLSIESGYTGAITSNRSLTVGTDGFTLQDGSFTAPSSTLTLSGNFTHSGGTFSHNSGTVAVSGDSTLTTTNTTTFNDIEHGGNTTLSGDTFDINNNLTIGDGSTLDASTSGCSGSSCDIEVAGDWTNNGSFVPRNGTVTFNGSNQTLSGTTTFNNFTKSVTSADTITFPAGATTTVNGIFTLRGTSGDLLTATSSAGGTQWIVDVKSISDASTNLEYLTPGGSNNISSAGALFCYPGCIDGGGNTSWTFGPGPWVQPIYRFKANTQLRGGLRLR